MIARLSEAGWPAALFARHEALILTLAATGLPYSQLAALRVCAVAVNPVADALHVETVDGTWTSTPTALIDAGVSPATVPNSPASPESLTASVNQTGPSPVGAAYLPHLQGVTPLGETVARISAEILGLDP